MRTVPTFGDVLLLLRVPLLILVLRALVDRTSYFHLASESARPAAKRSPSPGSASEGYRSAEPSLAVPLGAREAKNRDPGGRHDPG